MDARCPVFRRCLLGLHIGSGLRLYVVGILTYEVKPVRMRHIPQDFPIDYFDLASGQFSNSAFVVFSDEDGHGDFVEGDGAGDGEGDDPVCEGSHQGQGLETLKLYAMSPLEIMNELVK